MVVHSGVQIIVVDLSVAHLIGGSLLVGAVLIAVAGPRIFEIDPEMAASLGMSADEISKIRKE